MSAKHLLTILSLVTLYNLHNRILKFCSWQKNEFTEIFDFYFERAPFYFFIVYVIYLLYADNIAIMCYVTYMYNICTIVTNILVTMFEELEL